MATGFFAILDDIAALMDDVATLGQVATKKTSGILGDDLAVSAEKATGFVSSRELPVLWKISLGSIKNKAIILPATFLLSYFLPIAVELILLAGGAFLAYEGAEKIVHFIQLRLAKTNSTKTTEGTKTLSTQSEEEKVKSAIFVDFILSIEIVIIALSTVAQEPILTQVIVVSFVALLATVAVYGIVALIVRMDDFGLVLNQSENGAIRTVGTLLIKGLPLVIKALSLIGTIALLMVSGEIFHHNIAYIHHLAEGYPSILFDLAISLSIGLLLLLISKGAKRVYAKLK